MFYCARHLNCCASGPRPGAGQPFTYRSCYNPYMLSLTDIVIRLFVAAVIGCLIGLNRFAHHRFIGVRTLGLVALGAAGLVVAALDAGSGSEQLAAASRIIQGIVTGIGFVGAGVIVQGARGHKVHGLTTAATVWVSAVAGILVRPRSMARNGNRLSVGRRCACGRWSNRKALGSPVWCGG